MSNADIQRIFKAGWGILFAVILSWMGWITTTVVETQRVLAHVTEHTTYLDKSLSDNMTNMAERISDMKAEMTEIKTILKELQSSVVKRNGTPSGHVSTLP